VSRSLMFSLVKFQWTSQLTYAEFLAAWWGISACTDRLWSASLFRT
jgi:hypothetical protein